MGLRIRLTTNQRQTVVVSRKSSIRSLRSNTNSIPRDCRLGTAATSKAGRLGPIPLSKSNKGIFNTTRSPVLVTKRLTVMNSWWRTDAGWTKACQRSYQLSRLLLCIFSNSRLFDQLERRKPLLQTFNGSCRTITAILPTPTFWRLPCDSYNPEYQEISMRNQKKAVFSRTSLWESSMNASPTQSSDGYRAQDPWQYLSYQCIVIGIN